MDAITLLKKDHQAVEKLFKRFEATGDRALVERRKIVDQIIEELSATKTAATAKRASS